MSDATRRREEKLAEEVIRRTRGCPPAEELAAYHDGTSLPDRSALAAHLPGCPDCRAALDYLASEASREVEREATLPGGVEERLEQTIAAVSREERFRPSSFQAIPVWMKLAASVFLTVGIAAAGYLWWSPARFDQDLGALRSNGALQALTPTGSIGSAPDRFTWSPHPLAVTYSVFLFDAEMNEIWRGRTVDGSTHLALDAEVRRVLSGGGKFSWHVSALDAKEWSFERSAINHFEIAAAPPTR